MEVLKRPRLSFPSDDSEDKHGELLIHSLLNFSENFNSFDPRFRVHKRPQNSFDSGLKLAPIQAVCEGLSPLSSGITESVPKPISNSFKKDSPSPQHHNSPKSESLSELQINATLTELPYSHSIQVVTQPVGFQIANYNIHPPPAIAVDRAISQNITIHAQLVENEKRAVVDGGFQSGDVRVLRAGHTILYFTGLKLNKMGPIKTELHFRDYKRIPTTFCIQFKIGNRTIFSEPFKLVSSCAQLPQEVRDIVRPTKKTSHSAGSSPESQQADELLNTTTSSTSSSSNPLGFPSLCSPSDMSESLLRRELEMAIESADVEGAANAARKLAYLKKVSKSER